MICQHQFINIFWEVPLIAHNFAQLSPAFCDYIQRMES